jgi:spermidine/putrescine transport system permease protein
MSSTIVAARPLPENRISPVFRFAMLLPGGLVTFFLILFALGLVVFLAFRSPASPRPPAPASPSGGGW